MSRIYQWYQELFLEFNSFTFDNKESNITMVIILLIIVYGMFKVIRLIKRKETVGFSHFVDNIISFIATLLPWIGCILSITLKIPQVLIYVLSFITLAITLINVCIILSCKEKYGGMFLYFANVFHILYIRILLLDKIMRTGIIVYFLLQFVYMICVLITHVKLRRNKKDADTIKTVITLDKKNTSKDI